MSNSQPINILPLKFVKGFILLFFGVVTPFFIFLQQFQGQTKLKNTISPVGDSGPKIQNISPVPYDIVFVSRQILLHGGKNIDSLPDMPGVGPHSRFRVCAPGKLLKYKTNGAIVTLVDGSNPTAASLYLIDVNAPDVNYNGTEIVFSGLTAPPSGTSYDTMPISNIGAWRIYRINTNGTGLTQITNSSLVIDNSQFNKPGMPYHSFSKYDDSDPVWMPDGRICFSTSRYPSVSDYKSGRTTNLFVMNRFGKLMHRITTERNGADRPMIDPLTGQIVFSRWWRNGRFPLDDTTTLANAAGNGYIRKDGLSAFPRQQSHAPQLISFNGWVAAGINPDGSDLHLFAGNDGGHQALMMFGGSFTSSNELISNYFPNTLLFEESGFGGITKRVRGAGVSRRIAGYTVDLKDSALNYPSGMVDSLKRYFPADGFASEASVLPDDRIIISWAPDYHQDYGLYIVDSNGLHRTLIYDLPGTSELRAKAIRPRPLPPVLKDKFTQVASMYPPLENGPYDLEGVFTFECLNVYGNGPVDMDITSAPSIGSAGSIRFFISHQRTRRASNNTQDWPILLDEFPIPPSGAITNPKAPANVPLFEQLRTSSAHGYIVPTTGGPKQSSTANVAGMNYGRPGQQVTCVGCHRGHSMIENPLPLDAEFTNLAPGAFVTVSSQKSNTADFLIDRKVTLAFKKEDYWVTKTGFTQNQWARLTFPVSIKIKKIVLYNIPSGGMANSTLQIQNVHVNLYADSSATQLVSSKTISQNILSAGTPLLFSNTIARCVEIQILNSSGTFSGSMKVGLAEIEVIASGSIGTPKLADNRNLTAEATVYPNPFQGKTNLTLQGLNTKADYFVYNMNGEIIISGQVALNKTTKTTEIIDLSSFKSGVYFIKIESPHFEKVLRMVKL